MNANLLTGNTLKGPKQLAKDAERSLKSARANLVQSIRHGLKSETILRDEQNVRVAEEAVAYWKKQGVRS